jgi:mannitol-specific phosphotransferase system IIBC component
MHTLKLQVNESIYSQVLSFINKFQTNELNLVEDTKQEDYIVSSVEEVQRRISKSESNADYISVDNFFSDMDKKIEAL